MLFFDCHLLTVTSCGLIVDVNIFLIFRIVDIDTPKLNFKLNLSKISYRCHRAWYRCHQASLTHCITHRSGVAREICKIFLRNFSYSMRGDI